MKKLFMLFALMLFVFPTTGLADWSVTVSWQRSTGPNLDREEIYLADVLQCTIQETEPTTCNFVVLTLQNQEIRVRSYNTQGAYADYTVGNLFEVPSPAGGGVITITYMP